MNRFLRSTLLGGAAAVGLALAGVSGVAEAGVPVVPPVRQYCPPVPLGLHTTASPAPGSPLNPCIQPVLWPMDPPSR